jgi:putative ABC transport system permease protein
MRFFSRWHRRDRDQEIREEFDAHLALEAERQVASGVAPEEAANAALRRFGNPIRYREDTRAVQGLVWWDHLTHDFRMAGRAVVRRPAAALAAMVALGIGMGGPGAVLSIILSTSTLVSREVQRPEELVLLWETPPGQPRARRDPSMQTYQVWREHASMYRQIAAAGWPLVLSLASGDTPERVNVQTMAVELLPLLAVTPQLGRAFAARDAGAGADPVALVSYGFWESRLGSRADVVGSTIELHGRHTTIVGVMPRAFWFGSRDVHLWVPLPAHDERTAAPVLVIARLLPGDDKRGISARLRGLAPQVASAQPDRDDGWGMRADGLGASELLNGEDMPPGFKVLFSAAVLGLLAACANIATVMVARGAARHLEIAVRAALGAPRFRLIRQFLVESIVVALGGGAVGLLVVVAAIRAIAAYAPPDLAMAMDTTPGPGLIAAIAVLSIGIGVFAGLGPALADSRIDFVMALKNSGYFGSVRGSSRLRRALVIGEVAITVMLLAGVTVLARGAIALASVGPGFDASRVINLQIDPVQHVGGAVRPPLSIPTLLERFTGVNGVESAALADGLTGRRTTVVIAATSDAASREARRILVNTVGDAYFSTVGLRLVEGRALSADDRSGAPVAVVSEVFARRHFPGGGAIGRAVRIGTDATERTIVGVVSDVLLEGFRREPSPIVYVPAPSETSASSVDRPIGIVVRTLAGASVLPDLRRALAAVDPLRTIAYAGLVQDQLAVGAMEVRATVYLAGPVILLALTLTMSGIYGVLAQAVTQRTHEVALRMALGADGVDVARLVVFQGLKLSAIGALAGAAGALAVDRLVGTYVAGVPGERPAAILTATALIVVATLIASAAPSLRAAHIDPAKTLKAD